MTVEQLKEKIEILEAQIRHLKTDHPRRSLVNVLIETLRIRGHWVPDMSKADDSDIIMAVARALDKVTVDDDGQSENKTYFSAPAEWNERLGGRNVLRQIAQRLTGIEVGRLTQAEKQITDILVKEGVMSYDTGEFAIVSLVD